MGCLHLIQGVLMLVLSTRFFLPITTLYIKLDTSTPKLAQDL